MVEHTVTGINRETRDITLEDGTRAKISDEQIERLYLSLLKERLEGARP